MKIATTSLAICAVFVAGTFLNTGSAAAAELTVAVASTFTTMDPYDAGDTLSQSVAKSFYEGLFGFDKDMKLIPVLAESAAASSDGLTYTIRLKQGIKFHDGSEFTADAVKANLDRASNPDNLLRRYTLYANIAATEVVDKYTVRITLKTPFSAFLNQLAHPASVMICPSALKKYPGKQIAFHPCGTGPFLMDTYNPSEVLRVTKNPNYHVKGLPKLDAITWLPVVENSSRVAMLKTGEAQLAYPLPFEQAAQEAKDGEIKVVSSPSIILRYISMNCLKKPLDNPKVRQAINYAINREALAKVAFNGFADPAEGVVPVGVKYAKKIARWPYDPKKARELLKEAGYPNGFETTLWSNYNHTTANKVIQFVQQQLAQVGIKCSVLALEAGQRTAYVNAKTPEEAKVKLYYTGWSSSTGEFDWAVRPLLATASFPPVGSNTAYYSNKIVDDGFVAALKTTDEGEKQRIYDTVQEQIWNDAPWVPLVTERNVAGSVYNLVDFNIMPDGGFDFYRAYLK